MIHIPDYTEEEKAEIARRHILPELFREYGIEEREIVFEKDVLLYIARHYCEDEGARDMKKHLRSRRQSRRYWRTVIVRSISWTRERRRSEQYRWVI